MKINLDDLKLDEGVEIELGQGYTVKIKRSLHNLTLEIVDSVCIVDKDEQFCSFHRITTQLSQEDAIRIFGGLPK